MGLIFAIFSYDPQLNTVKTRLEAILLYVHCVVLAATFLAPAKLCSLVLIYNHFQCWVRSREMIVTSKRWIFVYFHY